MAVSNISSTTISAFSAEQKSASQKSSQENAFTVSPQNTVSSSSTKLSLFGKVQVSLDDLQARAKALQGFQSSPNFNDLKVAVLGFVQAFHALNTDVTKDTTKQVDNSSRSSSALSAVNSALSGPNNEGSRTALEKIGITQAKDGSLTVNEKTLAQAFLEDKTGTLSLLAGIGQRVDQAAGQQLSGGGEASAKVNVQTDRSSEQDKQQKDLQQRQETQKSAQHVQAAQQAALAGSASAASHSAVATYIGVASL